MCAESSHLRIVTFSRIILWQTGKITKLFEKRIREEEKKSFDSERGKQRERRLGRVFDFGAELETRKSKVD
nr:hypothetical protein GTC16762_08800 [Pigmentibacter ruber]BFD33319.1 hypothetical protein GTC16762_29370 [Pigmentibacter ruber]